MSAVKPRVLELVTTPMGVDDGQTLFPLRIARRLTEVQADFLTFYVRDDRVREEVESLGGCIHVAPSRLRHPVKYIRFVSRVVRENGYRVVHAHGSSRTLAIDLLAARLGGAKVRIAHSHNTQCKFALLHRLLKPLFDSLYTHAFACGEEAGRWLFGKKPFTVIHNAIDTQAFAFDPDVRSAVRDELGLGNALVLGSVSNFSPAKNHAFLIDLFAQLLKRNPDCILVLVGDGALRSETENRAREVGIVDKIRFTGLRTDVARLLQAMDVMLLPSLHEGFPTVALEWQCAGLPVILSEHVTPDCAFVERVRFLPLEAERWVDCVLDLDDTNRKAASQSGIRALTKAGFDLRAAARSLEQEYLRFSEKQ